MSFSTFIKNKTLSRDVSNGSPLAKSETHFTKKPELVWYFIPSQDLRNPLTSRYL